MFRVRRLATVRSLSAGGAIGPAFKIGRHQFRRPATRTQSEAEFASQRSFRDLQIAFHLMEEFGHPGSRTVFYGKVFAHGSKFFGENND